MKRIQESSWLKLSSRLAIIAVLAITSLVSMAQAPKPSQTPQPPKPLPSNIHPGNGSSTQQTNDGINPQYYWGWNYVHATECELYDSGGYTYLVLYPQEGGEFWTSSAPYQNLLLAACQTGNWLGFYVYDSNGDWSAITTYDYR
jgi:hypothetical protein